MTNADTFLDGRSRQLAVLTLRHALPAIGGYHEFAAAGGLASYGGGLLDAYRLAGVSTGRIQGRKARRPACAAGDKDRAGHQPQDCEGAWSYSSTFVDGRADEVVVSGRAWQQKRKPSPSPFYSSLAKIQ